MTTTETTTTTTKKRKARKCSHCEGKGEYRESKIVDGKYVTTNDMRKCDNCKGTGELPPFTLKQELDHALVDVRQVQKDVRGAIARIADAAGEGPVPDDVEVIINSLNEMASALTHLRKAMAAAIEERE